MIIKYFTEKNSSSAAPVTASDSAARWTNPCNATRNFSAGDFAIWDVPEFEKIQRIQENLLATKDKAASLKTKLVSVLVPCINIIYSYV